MKKLSTLLAASMLLTFALTACAPKETSSSAPAPSESSSSTVSSSAPTDKKELIMATEAGFAPYEYYSGKDVVGVDVDIAKEIAKAMGAELTVADMAFDATIVAVTTGKADFAAAGMSITEERLQQVDFSKEYAVSKQVILVKTDSAITDAKGLEGKTAGVQLGTVADIVISGDMKEITPHQYTKYADAVQDLKNGKIDAIVMDLLPAQEIVKANAELKILDEELFTDKYAIAVKKGNTELLNQINTVIDQLIKDGKIDEFTKAHLA